MLFESRPTSITFVLTVLATSPYTQCTFNENALKVCGQDNDIKNVVSIREFLKMVINRRQELKSGHHCSEPALMSIHTMSSGVSLGLEESFTESAGPGD